MGLLPELADDLSISLPKAGWLITGYALGVAIGAPIITLLSAGSARRKILIVLMVIFIIGNFLCAIAGSYGFLMIARIVTSLCHGAFFGIGAVVASNLVPLNRRSSAVALMFSGLTLANVLGVPLGTALGQELGWRATFWAVTAIGVVALIGLLRLLPVEENPAQKSVREEFAALGKPGLWLALATTVMFSASMFALFTYIAPLLRSVTGLAPHEVSGSLLLIGVGLTLGNLLGGKLGDKHLTATLAGAFIAVAATATAFAWTSRLFIPAEINLFLWAIATFALVPALQVNVVNWGRNAPSLISTMNIGAFNVGNALGAWVGGLMIDFDLAITTVPLAAGGLAILGLVLTLINRRPGHAEPCNEPG